MSDVKTFVAAMCCLVTFASPVAFAADRPFTLGSVWTVTLVRVKPGKDEWNVMLLVEQKNWAAFDGAGDKFDTIAEKMAGPEKARMESLIKRSDVREIVGVRNLQEINFK